MGKMFFTAGPSQLYPTVKQYISTALENDIPSLSHRSAAFEEIYAAAENGIRQLLNVPADYCLVFLSSATEAMERMLQNCVEQDSYHLVNGAFSQRFFTIARELGKTPAKLEAPWGSGFDLGQLPNNSSPELIAVTHNETSTGVSIPMEQIYRLHRQFPASLMVVDIVSSAPYVDLDYNQVDAAFFSVQKGFGLPAGLGVLLFNQRCLDKALKRQDSGKSIGSYHSLPALLEKAAKNQNPETPNVVGIYLLCKVCADMLEKGIEQIRLETEQKAGLLYSAVEQHSQLRPFVTDSKIQSQTVIVADIERDSKPVIDELATHGFIVGSGYGKLKKSQIRIANFPAHDPASVEELTKHLLNI